VNSSVFKCLYDISAAVVNLFNFLTICNCCLDPQLCVKCLVMCEMFRCLNVVYSAWCA